jgi:peptidoglycan/xylan/chitin deacetylase (PgdA/CDA1 family)
VEDFDQSAKKAIPSMLISTKMLERHIDWLAKRFSLVSLDEIGHYLESGRAFPRPAAAITFDDGYSDVYHHGFPLLQRKGVPAAVFVVTDLVGTGRTQLFDRLYMVLRRGQSEGFPIADIAGAAVRAAGLEVEVRSAIRDDDEPFRIMTLLLNKMPRDAVEPIITALQRSMGRDQASLEELAPLTWAMIGEMHDGGITIGSHTSSHALLTSESLESAKRELVDSRVALESRLKGNVRHFAYPDGRFNPHVVQAVRSAGYRFAYSICHQRDSTFPLLTIPRKVLWERACLNAWGRFSESIMNCHAYAAFDSHDRCEHDHSTVASGEKNGTIN